MLMAPLYRLYGIPMDVRKHIRAVILIYLFGDDENLALLLAYFLKSPDADLYINAKALFEHSDHVFRHNCPFGKNHTLHSGWENQTPNLFAKSSQSINPRDRSAQCSTIELIPSARCNLFTEPSYSTTLTLEHLISRHDSVKAIDSRIHMDFK